MQIHQNVQSCKNCELHKDLPDGYFPVSGDGPIPAKIMLIGEALGETEVAAQKPFQGLAGRLLSKMLIEAGIKRKECYITNVVKCRPTKNNGRSNRTPSKSEINSCLPWLDNEMVLVKPRVVVTLGRIPLNEFFHLKANDKLEDFVGLIIEHIQQTDPFVIIPAYHPSFIAIYGKKYYAKEIEIFRTVADYANKS